MERSLSCTERIFLKSNKKEKKIGGPGNSGPVWVAEVPALQNKQPTAFHLNLSVHPLRARKAVCCLQGFLEMQADIRLAVLGFAIVSVIKLGVGARSLFLCCKQGLQK